MEPTEFALMDAVEDRMWWYRALHARLIAALADVHGHVLDAGCGTGGLLARLRVKRSDLRLIGLEHFGPAATRSGQKSGVPVVCGSVNELPFDDASFDAIIGADLLCHRAVDVPIAISELRRALRQGGRLIINVPAYMWLTSEHDRLVHNARRFSAAQATGLLLQGGFIQVHARYWNTLLFPLMVARRKLWRRKAPASDVAPVSPWLNAALYAITEIELCLPITLFVGGSLLVTAERP